MLRSVIIGRLRLNAAATATVVLAACLAAAGPALAFECPTPQPLARPGVLRETPARIATVGKELASGDTYNRIAAITADLRTRYPTVERGELVNYLVTAYCPVVAARPNLNDSQKRATVETFASEVMQQVY
jgi:hypothetical protein